MNTEQFLAQVKAKREAQGFKLTWFIPNQCRNFTAFAKDEAQKQAWLETAVVDGWELVQ